MTPVPVACVVLLELYVNILYICSGLFVNCVAF